MSSKDFDSILSDYDFFETHATEADEDAKSYLAHLRQLEISNKPIRLLDFGCGGGRFLEMLLSQLNWSPDQLSLSLVEPGDVGRLKAVKRLQPFTTFPIHHWDHFPETLKEPFDIILSNHVLYYVHPLTENIERLTQILSPSGTFLLSMANNDNPLIQIWELAFGLMNQRIPYNLVHDVASTLESLNRTVETEQVTFSLQFPDSRENRMKMLRFLLNEHLEKMPLERLLVFFDPFMMDGEIRIVTDNTHFRVGN